MSAVCDFATRRSRLRPFHRLLSVTHRLTDVLPPRLSARTAHSDVSIRGTCALFLSSTTVCRGVSYKAYTVIESSTIIRCPTHIYCHDSYITLSQPSTPSTICHRRRRRVDRPPRSVYALPVYCTTPVIQRPISHPPHEPSIGSIILSP